MMIFVFQPPFRRPFGLVSAVVFFAAVLAFPRFSVASPPDSGAAVMIRSGPLLAAPGPEGGTMAELKIGAPVQVLDRQGVWYRVSAGESEGWVRMFSLRLLAGKRQPRLRTRSAVMGVRGLGEIELKEAKPDPSQLELLDSFALPEGGLAGFEHHGESRLKSVLVAPSEPMSMQREKLEAEMGREVAAQVLGAAPLYDHPEIQRYVNRVGAWVARASDRPGLPWRFGVVMSDSVNAFAVPGGTVLITLGLYRLLRTESELAGVLAHEIAHVVRGHHFILMIQSRAMEKMAEKTKQMKMSSAPVKALLDRIMSHGAEVFSRALDRNAEFDSDRMAMILVADAGYDPYGLARVIQLLGRRGTERERGERGTEAPNTELIYKTHPDPEARLEQFAEFSSAGRIAGLGSRPDLRERFARHSLYGVELRRQAR